MMMRKKSAYFHVFRLVEPKMVQGLTQSHSLIFVLQKLGNKAFCKAVFLPYLILVADLVFDDVRYRIRVILRLKRRFSCNELVDSDSERPQIDSLVIAASEIDFRGQIEVRPYNSQHVSSSPSEEGLFADAEIDQFDLLVLLIVEQVFRFDVPVADIFAVDVLDGQQDFFDDVLELLFVLDGHLFQAGMLEVLHDQVGRTLPFIEIQCLVFYHRRAVKLLIVNEELFELQNVLFLYSKLFGCIKSIVDFISALINTPISSFTQLLQYLIFLQKRRPIFLYLNLSTRIIFSGFSSFLQFKRISVLLFYFSSLAGNHRYLLFD